MYLKAARARIGDESGMMLAQVVVVSSVLLAVLLAGFKSVQTSIQAANSTATSAAFKDLALSVEQNLVVSNNCATRLGITGALIGPVVAQSAGNGYPITVAAPLPVAPGPVYPPIAQVEGATPLAPEFKITAVVLMNIVNTGYTTGAVPNLVNDGAGLALQELERFTGTLSVRADRRSGFFGGAAMTVEVPILLGVDAGTGTIKNCTTRSIYRTVLGPPAAVFPPGIPRKTGLECIDRGGVPVLAPLLPPATGKTDWYACRFPIHSFAACGNGPVPAASTNIPGWFCYSPTVYNAGWGETYAY